MEPIPLRTVRPFVLDEVVLIEEAEEGGFDVTNQIEVSSFLKKKVNVKDTSRRAELTMS